MSDSKIRFMSDKIFVHRWPHNTPLWGDSVKSQLDKSINKKPEKKMTVVEGKAIQIENFEFHSLKKIGISVPFFKDECRIIFEAQFGELYAHVHITVKSGNFLDTFNQLMSWRNRVFPNT